MFIKVCGYNLHVKKIEKIDLLRKENRKNTFNTYLGDNNYLLKLFNSLQLKIIDSTIYLLIINMISYTQKFLN